MKKYIIMSFEMAKQEVATWLKFFKSQGINLEVREINVTLVEYPDNVTPQSTEIGFEPVLVGQITGKGAKIDKGFLASYDHCFRIEEMLTTGIYKWRTSEVAAVYIGKKVAELSSAMVVSMLEDWTSYMKHVKHIAVRWKLESAC